MQLTSTTDYEEVLQDLAGGTKPSLLSDRLRQKYVQDFRYLRCNATGDLAKFLDFISLEYMIDNVVMIITGVMRGEEAVDREELMAQCHPLGLLDLMPALTVSHSLPDLYNTVLVETPLGPYFRDLLASTGLAELNELNLEILRLALWKAYLEDFHQWCLQVDSVTGETMSELLAFEADRRIMNIVVNAIGTGLPPEAKLQLFPRIGLIWRAGLGPKLAGCDDLGQVRSMIEACIPAYRPLLDAAILSVKGNDDDLGDTPVSSTSAPSFEALAAEREVDLCKDAFLRQFSFTPFYAWAKLREQERRNIVWIAECIAQGQKENIHQYIPIF